MTCLALAIVLTFGITLSRAFRTIRPIFRERGKIMAEVTGRLTESLAGVRVIKGYHAEEREARVFGEGVQRLLDNVRKSMTAMSVMSLSATVLMGVVGAIVMYMGAHSILAGSMTLGNYYRFVAFSPCYVAPIISIVNIGTQISEALAGLERTRQVMGERPEDEDPTRNHASDRFAAISSSTKLHSPTIPIGSAARHFVRLGAGHRNGVRWPFRVGQVDHDRADQRFLQTNRRSHLVDGVDLDKVQLPSFRSQLGVVLQETFLFDGTIRDNVVFSRPDATEEEFLEACRIARVDEFAGKLDENYDTIVGERGVKLSGGQRQRLSIARAILADPRILILDEATSSLDSESEAMIQEGLSHLMKGRTTFVIAHRLSTIRRADQILVVEDGRIVERGTHSELFRLRGRYWDMYTRQHALDENLFLAPGEGDSVPEASGGIPRRRCPGLAHCYSVQKHIIWNSKFSNMQVLQAGPHKLILLEIDPAAVSEVAEQAGFETRTKDSPGNILLDITATQRETPLLLFDAADPANLGWFSRCQFYVDGRTGGVMQTPISIANKRDRSGRNVANGLRIRIAKELPASFRFRAGSR